MIDQLNREYTDADTARAVEMAASLETEDSLDAIIAALGAKAEELSGTDPRVAELIAADVWVCQMQIASEAREAKGDSPLVPKVTFTDGSALPPPVREWPDTVRPYFVARATGTTLEQTRARYNDFVWARWGLHPNARAARDAYLSIARGRGFQAGGKAARTILELGRAVTLAQTLDIERAETGAIIADEIEGALAEESLLGARLVTPNAARLLALDAARATALVGALMAAAQNHEDPYWAREIYGTAGLLASELKSAAGVAAARSAIASSWEDQAANATDPMTRLHFLRGALVAYQAIPGNREAVQRLRGQLAEASADTAQNLPMHKFEFKISNEHFDADVKELRAFLARDQFGLLKLPIWLGVLPDWDKLQASFDELRTEYPLQYLFPRVSVERDGRMRAEPADEAEREEALVLGHFAQQEQLGAIIALNFVVAIRESGEWSAGKLIEMLEGLDPDMASACSSGIEAFEAGDFWTAVHVLMPQAERGLRNVAVEIDGNVHRLIGTDEVRVATLDKILEDPAFEAKFGANTVKSLRGLLTDPRGMNLRNLTAHGLLDPAGQHAPAAFVALMCVLIAVWLRASVVAEKAQASAS